MLAPQTLVDKLKEPIAQARTKQCHRFGYGLEILTIDNQAQEASTDANRLCDGLELVRHSDDARARS
jgi:hypothetical protein